MPYHEVLNQLFDDLWRQYRRDVPHADRYVQLVEQAGGRAVNDHIAIRSFNTELPMQPAGFAAARRIFETLGYVVRGEYDFPETHLSAIHLEYDDGDLPRVFVSQLEVNTLSDNAVHLIRDAVSKTNSGWAYPHALIERLASGEALTTEQQHNIGSELATFFARPWTPPPRASMEPVNEASQYAAWTLLHGNAINHFTASINHQQVSAWSDIEATIAGMRDAGIPMKDGIEGERGSKLRQSSTQAVKGEFPITESDGSIGTIPWTYAYYELAERGYEIREDGTRAWFNGFLGAQTPGLFEMTRVK